MALSKHAEWSTQDVVDKYLKPINMEHMAKDFLENNINGAVLLALEVSFMCSVILPSISDKAGYSCIT